MTDPISMNATTSAYSMLADIPASSWTPLLAIGIFVAIIVTIFLISKNFRRLLYGVAVSVPLAAICWCSLSIAKPAGEGNWQPFLWLLGVVIGVPVMILIGKVTEHLGWFKSIEDSIKITIEEEPKKEDKDGRRKR